MKRATARPCLPGSLTDLLSLSGDDSFRVYDTDFPDGDLAGYFPNSSRVLDFSKTGGQVEVFDTILSEPDFDYVIDLDAGLIDSFFRIFSDIGFGEAAREAHLGVAIYFILDRKISSVQKALAISRLCKNVDFVPVRNEAMGNILAVPQAASIYHDIRKNREIQLPRLSIDALNFLDRPDFSFAKFLARNGEDVPFELRIELWAFLEAVYNQRKTGDSGNPVSV